MTEQPVETEQQFLGNEVPVVIACANCSGRTRSTVGMVCPACGKDFSEAPPAEASCVPEFGTAIRPTPLQHYSPNAHRFRAPIAEPDDPSQAAENGPTNLELEAEVHAGHAVRSLENGELDAGIAWLQSALAFAQNARHIAETAPKVVWP